MFNFINETHEYILFLDIEFDQTHLIQFAGLLFRRVNDSNYVPYRSLNVYIQRQVSNSFSRYTHISNDFLTHNGVTIDDAIWQIQDNLLEDVDDLLLVSHGLHGDLTILQANGIYLKGQQYCTFEHARTILKRKTMLSLTDIAREAVIYPVLEHNAYVDAWRTVGVYSFLKDLED